MEILDVFYDPRRKQFGVGLAHPSFPEAPEGCPLPNAVLTEVLIRACPATQESADGPVIVEVPA